ncbi:Phosphoglycerate dehydrogenase [Actinokineospora alba]|uniref:Phosphoglycerate dehydrogenase n=1 Tax=Actinokineospora alba TaxID=504798 RepID=A0A1H0HWG8_9PSEU|nr:phosphoglycerate dehydrogenase-like enzyme [Actinokineospora alba]SDH44011.1 Phosphoglycerate dehydrogenase [Actinokineospora alba]SDO23516.1 Phosphoglycerate dehydrogenase [Actinokineospora alba]
MPDEHGIEALSGIEGLRVFRHSPRLPPEAADAEVLIPDFLGGEALNLVDRLPKLRLVQLLTTGADAWAGRLPDHIMLSTCRGAHGGSSAEWVVGALLTFYREFTAFDAARRVGKWTPHTTDTLQDKRILVIGAGDLGHQLRRRFDAFDARTTLVASRARDGVHGVDELPALLPEHDAVVLVVPLTEATTRMVDKKFLSLLPDGAIVVNAARGPVVDTDALLAELTSGRLRAALDVTDPEPLPADHPLWTAPNIVITPHVAGNSAGHRARAYRVAAAEIARFAAGKAPLNLLRGAY